MKRYDYALIVASVTILVGLGAVSLAGTGFAWVASGGTAAWNSSPEYLRYVETMNAASVPLAIGLVLALVLCIPKRIVARRTLILSTTAIFAVSVAAAALLGLETGLGVLLISAMLIQGSVVVLTATGSKRLHFLTEGFYSQFGSGLLHLGSVGFFYDLILLQNATTLHTITFWMSTLLITAGMILSFYQKELSWIGRKSKEPGR